MEWNYLVLQSGVKQVNWRNIAITLIDQGRTGVLSVNRLITSTISIRASELIWTLVRDCSNMQLNSWASKAK